MNKATQKPTNSPQGAVQGPPQPSVGEPKDAARKGALSILHPNPQTGDGRYPVAWLVVRVPRGTSPTATSRCECGRDRRAIGRTRVLALIDDHTAHRDHCPLRNPQEGRTAA